MFPVSWLIKFMVQIPLKIVPTRTHNIAKYRCIECVVEFFLQLIKVRLSDFSSTSRKMFNGLSLPFWTRLHFYHHLFLMSAMSPL